jgi:hypothetical protein
MQSQLSAVPKHQKLSLVATIDEHVTLKADQSVSLVGFHNPSKP